MPYLGNEPCWIRITVKGRTFYKNYAPTFDFDLPGDLGADGEEVEARANQSKRQLKDYFTEGKWKYLREAKFGIPIAIYLRDLDKIIQTEFKEGIEHTSTLEDLVWNPNYEGS